MKKTTVSGAECGLHDGPALGLRPSGCRKMCRWRSCCVPRAFRATTVHCKMPERVAGGERPAEIPDAGGAALAVPFRSYLDGDGQQDAAVLYTTAQSSNVCIAFLQKDAAGVWQVRQSIEGLADTVDNVRLAQLQDGAATQLVVGYLAAQGTAIWRCTPTRTARSMPFWNSPMSSIWWRISPAAATRNSSPMSTLEDGGGADRAADR